MRKFWLAAAFVVVFLILNASQARAEEFKSPKQCVAGKRVVDLRNRTGTVIDMHEQTMCKVKFDSGETENLLFWMLHPAGESAETNDKLVPGVYECFGNGRYLFMDIKILSADAYESAGVKGKFHVEPSRKIVFESGSLTKYHSKLLTGPNIGLNTNGGTFYATTCELRKGKK